MVLTTIIILAAVIMTILYLLGIGTKINLVGWSLLAIEIVLLLTGVGPLLLH